MESSIKIVKTEAAGRTQHVVSLEKHGLEKLNPIKIEQGINRALEEKILFLEREIDALKRGKSSDKQVINEMNVKQLESEQSLKELRVRVSDLEVEKKVSGLIMKVLRREKSEAEIMLKESEGRSSEKLHGLEKEIDLLKRPENKNIDKLKTELSDSMIRETNLRERHAEAEQNLEDLQVMVSNLECEKRADGLIIEELRRGKLKADETVKESRKRSLKAREAVEVSIRRLENVVPIAEGFFMLLKMNVDNLVGTKNMLGGEEDVNNEHGMTGRNEVGPYNIGCNDKTRNSELLEATDGNVPNTNDKRYDKKYQRRNN